MTVEAIIGLVSHAGDRHAAEGMKRRDWEWARMRVNAEARYRKRYGFCCVPLNAVHGIA